MTKPETLQILAHWDERLRGRIQVLATIRDVIRECRVPSDERYETLRQVAASQLTSDIDEFALSRAALADLRRVIATSLVPHPGCHGAISRN
jgi:hypothetical protein